VQSIVTRYIGATDTKPARIVAITSAGGARLVMSVHKIENIIVAAGRSADNTDSLHDEIARMLCVQLDWVDTPLMRGDTADGAVYVFDCHANRVRFTEAEQDIAVQKRMAEHARKHGIESSTDH